MFNPLKNPTVIRTILDKAERELNEAVRYRKRQFNNPNLYFWVEIDKAEEIPYISLCDENDIVLVKMTASQLMEDEAIKNQLNTIPSFVRSFLNFKKLIPAMNKRLMKELKPNQNLKIVEGKERAEIELWENNRLVQSAISLVDIFG